ncbi:cytochrome P450 [Aspergillus recurvatus]
MSKICPPSLRLLFHQIETDKVRTWPYIPSGWSIPVLPLAAVIVLLVAVIALIVYHHIDSRDDFPTVNRTWALEPSVFSRLRFAFNSEKILRGAYQKYKGQAYRLARGDVDYIVLPPECVTELNRLPASGINSRMCHAFSMTGRLNGMNVVLKSNLHVKTLLNRITPALPALLGPASTRIQETMQDIFPNDSRCWTTIEPMDLIVRCVSRVIALAAVGEPVCDDPEFVDLIFEHTKSVFTVMMAMRLVPEMLQSLLVWTLPAKWQLQSSFKRLQSFVGPVVNECKAAKLRSVDQAPSTLLAWMVAEAKTPVEEDPYVLTELLAALAAGGTYSSANFIVSAIFDLVAHPVFLEEIREEFRQKHNEIQGRWDFTALNSLPKLDSAFKETIRLTPGSLTTYSRVMLQDYILSTGIVLKKGQFICVPSYARSTDTEIYTDPTSYDALRAYNASRQEHAAQPFKGVYGQDFRWGAGRWACAGRHLATLVAKFLVVKLLDEYDFQFVPGSTRPPNSVLHEFVFVHPSARVMVKQREKRLGISCC